MNFMGIKPISGGGEQTNHLISRINNHSHSQNHSNKLANSLNNHPK